MHVVFTDYAPQNLNFKSFACLTDKLSNTKSELSLKHVIPILRDPNKVVLNFKFCMTPLTIFHAEAL